MPPSICIRRWLLPLLLLATIAFASGKGDPQVPGGGFPGLDKIAHVLVFGLVATAICRIHPRWALRRSMGWVAMGVTSLFGLTDEWLQSMNPHRLFEWADLAADVFGAVLAVTVYQRWHWYRSVLESEPFAVAKRWLNRLL